MKSIITILFTLLSVYGFSQAQYFISTNGPTRFSDDLKIESFDNGDYCIAGFTNRQSSSNGKLFIKYYNQCGLETWSRQIEDTTNTLRLSNLNIDSNANIVISGTLLTPMGGIKNPFIIKFDSNGNLISSHLLNSNHNTVLIHYTTSINPQGQSCIYGSMTLPDLTPIYYVLNLQNNQIQWIESYDLSTKTYGELIPVSDKGYIGKSSNAIFKLDSLGNIKWINTYQWNVAGSISNTLEPLEVDSGYVFFATHIGAIDRSFAFMVKHDGTVGWSTPVFLEFFPTDATINQDKNITLIGSNHINGNGFLLLELNQKDGSAIRLKELILSIGFNGLVGSQLTTNLNDHFVFTATDNRGILPQMAFGRLDTALMFNSCQMVPLTLPSGTVTISVSNSHNMSKNANKDLFIEAYQPIVSSVQATTESFICGNRVPISNQFKLGNDTILCPKIGLVLGDPTSNFDSYIWSTGETTKTINVGTAGLYWLEVKQQCKLYRDSIRVDYYPNIGLSIKGDTVLCPGSSVVLEVRSGLNNYLWSTGSVNHQAIAQTEGWYWVETQTNCGLVRDSIYIYSTPSLTPPNLADEISSCPTESVSLNGGTLSNYLWSNGSTSPSITVNDTGRYWLSTFNSCDTLSDTIHFKHFKVSPIHILVNRQNARTFDTLIFKASSSNFVNYEWTIEDEILSTQEVYRTFKKPGFFKISLKAETKDLCIVTHDTIIEIIASPVTIPNVFTPNNDGINELFSPLGKDISNYSMSIFNKWNEEVFKSEGIPWNGRHENGEKLPNSQYFYVISIQYNDGTTSSHKGTISLLR